MKNKQLNISNLTQMWRVAGETFGGYIEDGIICSARIENSEWPNRIWLSKPFSEDGLSIVKSQMEKEKELVFPHFEADVKPLADDEHLSIKSKQYGMSLPLERKFQTRRVLDFRSIHSKADAELWSNAFYQAFQYNISAETLLKIKNEVRYSLVYSDGQLVGTVALFITGQVAGIHSLGVLPTQRNQGFASEIMRHVLNYSLDQNLALATLQASEMAREMYLKLGFSQDFVIQNYHLM